MSLEQHADTLAAAAAARNAILAELERRKGGRFQTIFPAEGPYRRELYPKHMELFAAGATYKERLFMKANRVGGTRAGAFEVTCHLTGRYPDWWTGRRFHEPGEWWAAGTTSETTRDIVQAELLGKVDPGSGAFTVGTGMIPPECIVDTSRRPHGLPGSIESIWVRHVTGGLSVVGLKTYAQGRESFEGTAKQGVWFDEEPPEDVYTEALYRTATTKGITLITFTPLQGMSKVVTGFLTPEREESKQFKWFIQAGWKDVPHLDEDEKAALIATTPPYLLQARTEGTPSLGAGAIFPIAESDVTVKDFEMPDHWPKAFAMDHGWNWFGAVWMAYDRDTRTRYLYSCYKRSQAEPPIHAAAIKARGEWIPGVGDCSDINKYDGQQFLKIYRDLGLTLKLANKAVETGLTEVWKELSTGRLKVFASCAPWFDEYRLYHRNEQGVIVKVSDHLMDACVVGDTEVVTPAGRRRLDTLVGQDGWVLTRAGAWARFIGARQTRTQTPVVRLRFADGYEVRCTPDHPFLTPHGWTRADQMAGRSCYNAVSQRIQWHSVFQRHIKSFKVAATTYVAGISSAMACVFTEWCGLTRMVGLSLSGSPCITRTMTAPITIQAISFSCAREHTPPTTSTAISVASLSRLWKQRRRGIDLGQAARGTERTPTIFEGSVSSPVSSVARHSPPVTEGRISFARTGASLNGARRLVWMIKNGCAWCAADLLWRIVTCQNAVARASAVKQVVSIEEAGRADVYCLTVPGPSAFALANGAVVHNTRYLVRAGWEIFKTEAEAGYAPVAKKDPFEAFTRGSGSGQDGWMGA